MSSTVSKVCKISSIIVGILCFIGGIVIGKVFGGRDFDFISMITVWVSSFLFCLFLYAIGELIDLLVAANNNLIVLAEQQEELASRSSAPTAPTSPSASPAPASGDWVCKKCGARNKADNRFCKECDTYKLEFPYFFARRQETLAAGPFFLL